MTKISTKPFYNNKIDEYNDADVYIPMYAPVEDIKLTQVAINMSSYIVDYSARAPFVADTVAALSVDRLAIATPEDDRIAFRDASSFKSMRDRGKEKKLHKPQTT